MQEGLGRFREPSRCQIFEVLGHVLVVEPREPGIELLDAVVRRAGRGRLVPQRDEDVGDLGVVGVQRDVPFVRGARFGPASVNVRQLAESRPLLGIFGIELRRVALADQGWEHPIAIEQHLRKVRGSCCRDTVLTGLGDGPLQQEAVAKSHHDPTDTVVPPGCSQCRLEHALHLIDRALAVAQLDDERGACIQNVQALRPGVVGLVAILAS